MRDLERFGPRGGSENRKDDGPPPPTTFSKSLMPAARSRLSRCPTFEPFGRLQNFSSSVCVCVVCVCVLTGVIFRCDELDATNQQVQERKSFDSN